MAQFTFQNPDGSPRVIEAADRETALQALRMSRQGGQAEDAPMTIGGVGAQLGASIGSGAASLAGMPGTIRDYMQQGMQKGMSKGYELVTGDTPDPETKAGGVGGFFERMAAGPSKEVREEMAAVPIIGRDPNGPGIGSGAETRKVLSKLTGGYTDRQPKNVAEEYARTIGEFLPSAAALGGLGLGNLGWNALVPALTSETAGQVARNASPKRPSWMPDWVPEAETIARVGGAVLGPAALRKVISPNATSNTARLDAANRFEKEGIPYTAGQKTGSRNLQFRETETGGAPYAAKIEQQQTGINKAVLKRLGVNADEATGDVMTQAHKIASDKFESVSANNSIMPQSQLGVDLKRTVKAYQDKVSAPNRAPIVDNMIQEISNAAKGGKITGAQYQSMVTRLREAGTGANADLAIVTRGLRNNLDDAMERSIAAHNPADLGKWKDARRNWRDLIAVEDTLKTGAGGESGIINPTKLRQVTSNQQGSRGAAQTDVNDDTLAGLAKAAKTLTKSLAQDSGTSTRRWMRIGGAGGVGGTIGAGVGSLIGGPMGALIGAGVGGAAGPAAQMLKSKVLMSAPMQKYLSNQLAKPPVVAPAGGVLRMLEQSDAASRAKTKRAKRKNAG